MTKKPTQTTIDRATLAAELRHLADQLDTGLLMVEGGTVPVGDPLFLKTKRKVKEDRAYLTFSCKIALALPPETKAAAKRKSTATKPPSDGTPAAAKTIKKEIARLWKEMAVQVNAESRPSAAEASKLRRLLEDYRLYTPPTWADAWQACGAAVGRCLDAAAAGDFATARRLIAEINQQTKSCHTLHK